MPIEGQELLTLPEHLSSPPDFSWVRVVQSLVFCVVFCRPMSFFVVSDYPFGIFKFSYDHNVTPLPVENAEITCNDYVLPAYDKICYIGKVLENDLSDKTVHIVFIVKSCRVVKIFS